MLHFNFLCDFLTSEVSKNMHTLLDKKHILTIIPVVLVTLVINTSLYFIVIVSNALEIPHIWSATNMNG